MVVLTKDGNQKTLVTFMIAMQVTKPVMYLLVKICCKLLQVASLLGDFLASADIKAFGLT